MRLASRTVTIVGFDLSEKVITIYRDEEAYSSPLDFLRRLPLTIGEMRVIGVQKFSSRLKINCAKNQHTERKILWLILAQRQKKI